MNNSKSKLRILRVKLSNMKYRVATVISPVLNTKMIYKASFGKKINLKKPETFNEKLLWLKLNRYMKNPLVIQCADKYRVREYVKECGCEDLLNELLGVWDKAEDIPWDDLPEKFALKWNYGAGMNIICSDKSKLNREEVIAKLDSWRCRRTWLSHSELQYKYIPRKIICEKYLEQKGEQVIPDYKVYCFHSEPKAVFVMHDRGVDTIKTEFFDINWNSLENFDLFENVKTATEKPECLEQMLDASRKLSKPFEFVRCDFYVVNGKLYFGELTFTPAGCMTVAQTKIDGKDMAELIHLPTDK